MESNGCVQVGMCSPLLVLLFAGGYHSVRQLTSRSACYQGQGVFNTFLHVHRATHELADANNTPCSMQAGTQVHTCLLTITGKTKTMHHNAPECTQRLCTSVVCQWWTKSAQACTPNPHAPACGQGQGKRQPQACKMRVSAPRACAPDAS